MSNMTVTKALNNILAFNAKRDDSVGNFADLTVNASGNVEVDHTKWNVARFAATFFSLGLYQGYRNENRAQSLEVQRVLNLSVETLVKTPDSKLSVDERKMREEALKVYFATLFETRTILLPPPFLARFYYWVLGFNNQILQNQRLAFGSRAKDQLNAIENVRKTAKGEEIKPFSGNSNNNSQALAVVHVASGKKEIENPLTDLEEKYLDLAEHSVIAEEEFEAKLCLCSSAFQYSENKKKIEQLQNQTIAKNINLFVANWKQVDLNLANEALEAGYLPDKLGLKAIEEYYRFLEKNPNSAAQLRRDAHVTMSNLQKEVSHEVMLDLFRAIQQKKFPEYIYFIMNAIGMEGISFPKMVFLFICSKVNEKIVKRYDQVLKDELRILVNYQVIMLGLKTFGFMNPIFKSTVEDLLFDDQKVKEKLKSLKKDEDKFDNAFQEYVAIIKHEQTVHLALMQDLAQNPEIKLIEKDYLEKVIAIQPTNKSQKDKGIAKMQNNWLMGLVEYIKNAPDLDINGFGVKMTELDRVSQEKANDFAKSLLMPILWWGLSMRQMVENMESDMEEYSSKFKQIDQKGLKFIGQ